MVTRKLPMQGGAVIHGFIAEMQETADHCRQLNHPAFAQIGEALERALGDMDPGHGLDADPHRQCAQ